MYNKIKYLIIVFILVLIQSKVQGQQDTALNKEKYSKYENQNWRFVNDSNKTKFDFFMEDKTWGLATDISSSFKKNSNFISLRYFFADLKSGPFGGLIEISTSYNFNKVFKGSLSYSIGHVKISPFFFGFNIEYFRYLNTTGNYLSPLIRFEAGFLALEYSRRLYLKGNINTELYPNSLTLIIRPRLLFQQYSGENYSQYWDKKIWKKNRKE